MKKAYQTKEMTSEEPARAPFSLPEIQVNPSGWGPSTIETKFKDMPYQPFSKSDRLGKVCYGFFKLPSSTKVAIFKLWAQFKL